jgi:hypothetical protein
LAGGAATIAATVLAGFNGIRGRRSGWSGNPKTPVTVNASEAQSAS